MRPSVVSDEQAAALTVAPSAATHVSDRPVAVSPYIHSVAKRAFDIVLALTGLLLSVPVWLVASLAIVLEDGWPVLYVQRRVGRGGRTFPVLKFRSMVGGAEEMTGPVSASRDDPRITRVSRPAPRHRFGRAAPTREHSP